jgi:hypothetical protein
MSVFRTYARSLPHPPQFVGVCHACGWDLIDINSGPAFCPCWDEPPPEFDIPDPDPLEDMP